MDLQQKQSDDDLSTTLLRALETNPCFLVDRTTGLGKSYTCADVTMQYLIKGKRVIYIYPGNAGLAQFSGYLHTFLERYVKDDAPDKIASLLAHFTPISYAKLLNSFKSNPEELAVLILEL